MSTLQATRGFLQYLYREVMALPNGEQLWRTYFEHACAVEGETPALQSADVAMLSAGLRAVMTRDAVRAAMHQAFGEEVEFVIRADACPDDEEVEEERAA